MQEYQKWLNHPDLPKDLHQELLSIQGNQKEIEERFGQNLHFGTAGFRGILGAGLNRLNIYTVRRASWALARYLLAKDKDAAARGVAIGYDCRHKSFEFAREAALTLAAEGVRAYVSKVLCPTPEVSFSIRHLNAAGGVMITASHNPPEYNGYKVYGPDGYQLLPDATSAVHEMMEENQDVFVLPSMDYDEAVQTKRFSFIPPEVRKTYIQSVVDEVKVPDVSAHDRKALTVVYTPLHGAGNVPVREALRTAGYDSVHVVKEQEEPNGDFPTVKSPNPEEHDALALGIKTASGIHADLVMGTDPDSDRVGIAVLDANGTYQLLTGNQVGALLIDFLLMTRKLNARLPSNGIVFKTIVTSDLGRAVAESYGVAVENTLTGFKYIGHGITEYEQTGEHTFLFGYEESYGYLVSPIVRDKDAVQTCLAIAEMTAFYKQQNKSLLDVLESLFDRFGFYTETQFSVMLDDANASTEVKRVMDEVRKNTPRVEGLRMVAIEDYALSKRIHLNPEGQPTDKTDTLRLPTSNVLKYLFDDGSWLAIRPSGTEPKIKTYLAARGVDTADCESKTRHMKSAVEQHLKAMRG